MKTSLYSFWDVVYYVGQLWRVVGPAPEGRLHIRRCGWEHSWGTWGWDAYGKPLHVAAEVSPNNPLMYLA
jgi:hypothetical protein